MDNNRVREVWRHKPTGDRWIVETDGDGVVVGAAGPFKNDEWHPELPEHVIMDRWSANYVKERRLEFVREQISPGR